MLAVPGRVYEEAYDEYQRLMEDVPRLLEEGNDLEIGRNLNEVNQAHRQMGLALIEQAERLAELSPPPEAIAVHQRLVQAKTRYGTALLSVADGQMYPADVGEVVVEHTLALESVYAICG